MREIFYPNSLAVVGVSSKPTNLGRNIVSNLIGFGFQGIVYAVGPSGGVIATRRPNQAARSVGAHVRKLEEDGMVGLPLGSSDWLSPVVFPAVVAEDDEGERS